MTVTRIPASYETIARNHRAFVTTTIEAALDQMRQGYENTNALSAHIAVSIFQRRLAIIAEDGDGPGSRAEWEFYRAAPDVELEVLASIEAAQESAGAGSMLRTSIYFLDAMNSHNWTRYLVTAFAEYRVAQVAK